MPTQHLMCELYMHGCLLHADKEFNLVPYVGDIHLRALTSYTLNQISWQNAFNTFESNQTIIEAFYDERGERAVSDYV